jgi:hypothetical protein
MNLGYNPTHAPFDRGLTVRGSRAGDRYLLWLGLVLTGYTLFSRGFAYLGVPPISLFIGEIMIAVGVATVVRAGTFGPLFQRPATWLVALYMALAVVRMVPYLGVHGIDAPRDFMQVGYAVYAFIVASLLVARPERLADLVRYYRTYVVIVLSLIWLVYLVYKTQEGNIPKLPWASNTTIFEAKGGDIMVQLTGITMFLVLGMMKRTPLLMLALALNTGIVIVSNRGGMVAWFLGCALAWALRPPQARVGRLAYALTVFIALGLIIGPMARINSGGRSISVEQIVLNIKSVFGQGGDHLDGTKEWRLEWWTMIYNYTVAGENFWTGKGFGINLAKEDGFDVIPELRSPHNGHMTILARMGVPGAVLWVLIQIVWGLSILRQWLIARQSGRHRWMALFAFLSAYWVAFHVNAAFDVYFEGPMGGIWYWSVFGTGLAAVWIHANRPDVLDDADEPLEGEPLPTRTAPPTWGWKHTVPDDTTRHAGRAGGDGAAGPRTAGPQLLPTPWG